MTERQDPQQRDEQNRQQGHAERDIDRYGKLEAFRADTPDRGALRDDGEVPSKKTDEETLDRSVDVVVDPSDPRAPNTPDTYEADKGPIGTSDAADDPNPKGANAGQELLEEAYSKNDPGVKTED